MDEVVQIRLQTSSGKTCSVSPVRSTTLRSVLAEVNMKLPNPVCVLHGRILSLDMSIASQGIKSSDTIYVVSQKTREHRQRSVARPKVNSSLLQEGLRVADVALIQYELCRDGNLLYEFFSDFNQVSDDDESFTKTVVGTSTSIGVEPLPICWEETEIENEGGTVFSSLVFEPRPKPRVHCESLSHE